MIYTTTLTQKGQVTIPADIRRFLGLKSYEKVSFIKEADKVTIQPATTFLNLKGSITASKKYNDREADKAVLRYYKKNHGK